MRERIAGTGIHLESESDEGLVRIESNIIDRMVDLNRELNTVRMEMGKRTLLNISIQAQEHEQ